MGDIYPVRSISMSSIVNAPVPVWFKGSIQRLLKSSFLSFQYMAKRCAAFFGSFSSHRRKVETLDSNFTSSGTISRARSYSLRMPTGSSCKAEIVNKESGHEKTLSNHRCTLRLLASPTLFDLRFELCLTVLHTQHNIQYLLGLAASRVIQFS